MSKKIGARVSGPYREPNGTYRIIVFDDEGGHTSTICATEKEALDLKALTEKQIASESTLTCKDAIDDYEEHLSVAKGNKQKSTKETIRRLRAFFPADKPIRRVDGAELYKAFTRRKKANGDPISVDYHRNALAEARSFATWCRSQGWLPYGNPFDGVKGEGKRKHGKAQPRIDEFRKFADKAVELAASGDYGAVAALMPGLLGLRASEITLRQVRDLDDGGHLLWVEDAKTEKGNRQIEIPDMLRPLLLRLAAGKPGDEFLFPAPKAESGHHYQDWPRENVQRICRIVGVPEVCAHGMRGLHSSIAIERGATGHLVAEALGHESFSTTARSYARPDAVTGAKQRKAMRVLEKEGGNDDIRNGS